MLQVHLK